VQEALGQEALAVQEAREDQEAGEGPGHEGCAVPKSAIFDGAPAGSGPWKPHMRAGGPQVGSELSTVPVQIRSSRTSCLQAERGLWCKTMPLEWAPLLCSPMSSRLWEGQPCLATCHRPRPLPREYGSERSRFLCSDRRRQWSQTPPARLLPPPECTTSESWSERYRSNPMQGSARPERRLEESQGAPQEGQGLKGLQWATV
jgi:hypothetical protein